MRKIKRYLTFALAIVLLCGAALPAHAYGLFGGKKGPKPGDRVEVSADDRSAEGLVFDHWEANVPGIVFDDPKAPTTWFIVPQGVKSIDIEAKYVKSKPMMMRDHPDSIYTEGANPVVLGNNALKRSDVRTIEFVNSLDDAGADAWDVSEARDGSVLAWTEKDGSGKKLYIGGQGGVTAPEDASDLFCKYINLEDINFNGCFFTGSTKDMFAMFRFCSSLISVDLSGFDTANVENMSYCFLGCKDLKSVDLSGFDTRNVTDMSLMFSGCSSLSWLDVSGLDTSNVKDMSSMFWECNNLRSLDLRNFNTGNVEDMVYMFSRCSSLTSLDVSGFDTRNVKKMFRMFEDCSSLTSLDVSGFDTRNVTNMNNMFSGCSSLSWLDVSGFDTRKVEDMSSMFYGCSSLTSLDVSGFDTHNVTNMQFMFFGCNKLTGVDLSRFQ